MSTKEPSQFWVMIKELIEIITNNETTTNLMSKWHIWQIKKPCIKKDMYFGIVHIAKNQCCIWFQWKPKPNKRVHVWIMGGTEPLSNYQYLTSIQRFKKATSYHWKKTQYITTTDNIQAISNSPQLWPTFFLRQNVSSSSFS